MSGQPIVHPTYARPFDRLTLEPNPKRIRAIVAEVTVADSTATGILLGARHLPIYAFPREDVATDHLAPAGQQQDEVLGQLTCYDLTAGDHLEREAAWEVSQPAEGTPDLEGYLMFEWEAVDTWLEEEDEQMAHPPHPYHRVDVRQGSRSIEVRHEGVQLAASDRPVLVFETGLPTRYYLPREDVAMDRLSPSQTLTRCAYKGQATHFHASLDGRQVEDVAWSYETPEPGFGAVRELVCFYQERIDELIVDGQVVQAPETYWS